MGAPAEGLEGRLATTIGYQSCDDSTAQTAGWDSAKCATNARLYAGNKSVIGVVGTFNSGCAKIEVPILNRAHPGPMAMVSPANTNPGLTKHWDPGEPQKYYPTGVRNYARVVATDDFQGPADAMWSKSLGITKVYVLNDKQTYGFGVATTYKNAAKKLGIKVVGFKGWDAKQSSYESLANLIKASGAQAVFLGGIVCNNGAKLMQDLKSVDPKLKLQMPDGFSDPGANGAVANGAYISVAGQPPKSLTGQGATFIKSFGKQIGTEPNPYSQYGAQAMQVMLQAVASGGGDRAKTTKSIFGINITQRHHRQLLDQLDRRHQPDADHDLQAGRQEARAGQDAHSTGQPGRRVTTERQSNRIGGGSPPPMRISLTLSRGH